MAGRLLSVERVERRRDASTSTTVDAVTLVTDGGDVQQIALDPGVTVRIAEPGLNQEVGQYLSLVASERDQDLRRLTIATTGTGERDLFVSYVSEVPVWKATYRLVLPAAADARKPLLQGWAIVDNTVGEDWDNVELSLVAGAPQSFVQDISRPYYVQRPVVPLPERMSMTPQTHQGALTTLNEGSAIGQGLGSGSRRWQWQRPRSSARLRRRLRRHPPPPPNVAIAMPSKPSTRASMPRARRCRATRPQRRWATCSNTSSRSA